MSIGVEAITIASLRLALDAASLRQQAIASNIANAGSVGYARQRVSFDAQLEQLDASFQEPDQYRAFGLGGAAHIVQARGADGAPEAVQLDMEMADMAQNTVQYQALLKALSRHFAVLSSAVSDGKK
jgi:flagellar basal-body rod protein FlgB